MRRLTLPRLLLRVDPHLRRGVTAVRLLPHRLLPQVVGEDEDGLEPGFGYWIRIRVRKASPSTSARTLFCGSIGQRMKPGARAAFSGSASRRTSPTAWSC